jgi:transposase-like protein
MTLCKDCSFGESVKHGRVRGKQRYRYKQCGFHFVEDDVRVKKSLAAKKTTTIVLYSLAKASFDMLGKVFGVSRALTYRWIKEAGEALPEPEMPDDIKEMEVDELWRFIGSKKQTLDH